MGIKEFIWIVMNQTLPLLVRPSWAFILITEKFKTHLEALSQV